MSRVRATCRCFPDGLRPHCVRRLFLRFFAANTGWTLPALFSILRDLRDLAFDVSAFCLCLFQPALNRREGRPRRRVQWSGGHREHGGGCPHHQQSLLKLRHRQVWQWAIPTFFVIDVVEPSRMSPIQESRKWGVYYVVGLILKCYFRVCRLRIHPYMHVLTLAQVKRISLAKNILRAIEANPDIPPLSQYPRSHQVSHGKL